MRFDGCRLVGQKEYNEEIEYQKGFISLYFDEQEEKLFLDKYDFNSMELEQFPGRNKEKYYSLFLNVILPYNKPGKDYERWISIDYIHLGTDSYGENPKIIIKGDELKEKLFIENWSPFEEITYENFQSFIENKQDLKFNDKLLLLMKVFCYWNFIN
jgi:hypothetical protein